MFASSGSSLDGLYLYDFDQNRCNTLRQLTLSEHQQLETRLRQQNIDAQVTMVSRRYFVSTDKEECYHEQIQFPGWAAYNQKLWEVPRARERDRLNPLSLSLMTRQKVKTKWSNLVYTQHGLLAAIKKSWQSSLDAVGDSLYTGRQGGWICNLLWLR